MEKKKLDQQNIDVNFEAHPPIDDDLDGITALLKQTLLHYSDCKSLAKHLIQLKNLTQVIALESPDEENLSDDDEPDNDIYGVSSVIDISAKYQDDEELRVAIKQLKKFLRDKFSSIKDLLEEGNKCKIGLVINERYINLPPQLALPTLKSFKQHLEEANYSHLIFIAKILMQNKNRDSKGPNKKMKADASGSKDHTEPLVYVNAEEEIIFENAESHVDVDVSAFCEENATWSVASNIKYTPHRRILLVDYTKWSKIMKELETELSS